MFRTGIYVHEVKFDKKYPQDNTILYHNFAEYLFAIIKFCTVKIDKVDGEISVETKSL